MTDEELARAQHFRIAQPDLFQAWRRRSGRPTINGQPWTAASEGWV